MDEGDVMNGVLVVLITVLVLCVLSIPLAIFDALYLKPIANERANEWCRDRGYDYYETFSRVGIVSKEPMAIKCKFVEQARKIDLNVNGGIE